MNSLRRPHTVYYRPTTVNFPMHCDILFDVHFIEKFLSFKSSDALMCNALFYFHRYIGVNAGVLGVAVPQILGLE